MNKIVNKVLEGTVSLPRKYGKLTEEGVLGYREKQLSSARAEAQNRLLGEQKWLVVFKG